MTQRTGVVFHGCTEREAKRQLVRYWSTNRDTLNMTLTEFAQRCAILDPRTIVYQPERAPKALSQRDPRGVTAKANILEDGKKLHPHDIAKLIA